jgi:diguanylate cyclase (GGDEF)-like protein
MPQRAWAGQLGTRGSAAWLTALSVLVALGICAVCAYVIADTRKDAWARAEESSANLTQALATDIARNIEFNDLSLLAVIDGLQLPEIGQLNPETRQLVLFDRSASARYLGSFLVLDANGTIVYDSGNAVPRTGNFADRDYFQVHRDSPHAGLFISRPYRSRLRGGDWSIALSRRLAHNGHFAGVVVVALRLSYFQDLFGKLSLGDRGVVSLFRDDGTVLARDPFADADVGRNLSDSPIFRRFVQDEAGQLSARSTFDGTRRLYSYRRVGQLPLVINVAVSAASINAAWLGKSLTIGFINLILCGAMVTLTLMLRRELRRRRQAEAVLRRLASTDGLTGLANRRQLDERLELECRRAARDGTALGVLMIDADHFKAYNDHYGHLEGDRILQSVAGCILATIRRPGDFVARFGGEEFIVLLPVTELENAALLAERIRDAVAALKLPHDGNPARIVTVSIGVAADVIDRNDNPTRLVEEADGALYAAKHNGRNRVTRAQRPATAGT